MDAAEYFAAHLGAIPVMGIFRGMTPEITLQLCERAWDSGVDLVEVPVPDEKAVPAFVAAQQAGRRRGRQVGAGTIVNLTQLERVVALGVNFTVAPGFNRVVALRAKELGIPHLPGVATATDITDALEAGYTWVKAFPAAQLGADWIRAQRGPFADVAFVATGGIDAGNIEQFLAAGCRAVAIGSAFGDDKAIAAIESIIKHLGGKS